MKFTPPTVISRRGLGSLLVASPVAAQAVQERSQKAIEDARQARSAQSAQLKSVQLAREIEPSFRFEP